MCEVIPSLLFLGQRGGKREGGGGGSDGGNWGLRGGGEESGAPVDLRRPRQEGKGAEGGQVSSLLKSRYHLFAKGKLGESHSDRPFVMVECWRYAETLRESRQS